FSSICILRHPRSPLFPYTTLFRSLSRFEARFGDVVAVLHSALSRGERHDEWARLSRGEARVCVGPRSAVFAPLGDIGLIVVDEEDRKSTRLNSSHVAISYAVFCLK